MSETIAKRPLWGPFVGDRRRDPRGRPGVEGVDHAELSGGRTMSFLGGAVRLIYSENNGAVFGLFRGQVLIFAVAQPGRDCAAGHDAREVGPQPLHDADPRASCWAAPSGMPSTGFAWATSSTSWTAASARVRFYTFNVGDACISAAIVLLLVLAIWPSLAGGGARRAAGRAGCDRMRSRR